MSAIVNKHHGRVLYLTDKFGVSQGYLPAFNAITSRVGIPSRSIIITDIYKEVSKPLVKYRNEKTPRFNPDMMAQIKAAVERSEEHTSQLQSLMRISYAVCCLKKKKTIIYTTATAPIPYKLKRHSLTQFNKSV